MVAQLRLARRTELARRLRHSLPAAPRQLDLILDDTRFRGMTLVERQAVLRALARLLLEAGGVAKREAGDDNG
jgi:very-short-patch-repair endonuclease